MFPPPTLRSTARGVTLLELVTVLLVIIILGVMLLPVYSQVLRRTEKTACVANLHSLHVGMDLYMQEHHSWPQVVSSGAEPEVYAAKWIGILQPYGLNQINWICPTLQKSLSNPDLTDHDNTRIDYSPMTFDTKPQTPYRWQTMPWFAERADTHGNGQLLIFSDGHVQELGDFLASMKKSPPLTQAH